MKSGCLVIVMRSHELTLPLTLIFRTMKNLLVFLAACSLGAAAAHAQVLLDDDWSDGDLTKGSELEGAWFGTSGSNAIEVTSGGMILVSGTSGRGIHGVFNEGSLGVGDVLTFSFTFTTPASIAPDIGGEKGEGFRVGLFDSNGANMNQPHSYSSSNPNAELDLPIGYWLGIDVGTEANDFNFRERLTPATSGVDNSGRLLATSAEGSGFIGLAEGIEGSYNLVANTTYTGVFSVERTGEDSVNLSVELLDEQGASLATFSAAGSSNPVTTFNTIAFVANSNVFGSTSATGQPDNGVIFNHIKVEIISDSEPTGDYLGVFPIDQGWADTGTWLGWIFVADAPWVYLPELQGWSYVDEPSFDENAGGWLFFPR